MTTIKAIDHFGIAVRDLDKAIALFRDVFGARLVFQGDVPQLGVRAASFIWGDKEVGLTQPLRDDSPAARLLQKRGEGIEHLAVEVEDVAATVAELEARGIRVINKQLTGELRREAMVHPSDFLGILLQIVEWRGECKHSLEARLRFVEQELVVPAKRDS